MNTDKQLQSIPNDIHAHSNFPVISLPFLAGKYPVPRRMALKYLTLSITPVQFHALRTLFSLLICMWSKTVQMQLAVPILQHHPRVWTISVLQVMLENKIFENLNYNTHIEELTFNLNKSPKVFYWKS